MAIITADGRDITDEEWRVIPGFRKYKITKDGDLYGRSRGTLINETQNRRTGAYHYTLYTDDGRKTSRNYMSLVKLAWPENENDLGEKVA